MNEINNKELLNIALQHDFDDAYFIDNKCVLKKDNLEYGLLFFNEDKELSLEVQNSEQKVNSSNLEEQLLSLWREKNNGYNPETIEGDFEDCGDCLIQNDMRYYKIFFGDELYAIIKHFNKPLVKYKDHYYYQEDY